MRRSSGSLRNSGTYTSPGTPEYRDNNVGGIPKGWSSERVPLPTNSSRRHISSAALMPFYSGRTLPSKWDDAERWITSPLSGYNVSKNSIVQTPRRPKSKSGPLGTPGLMYLPNYSPPLPGVDGGSDRNFTVGSPFSTGVLLLEGAKSSSNCINPSSKTHQTSDLQSEASLDGKAEGIKEDEEMVSRVLSRRDMATQMSTHSSPEEERSSYPLPIPCSNTEQTAKMEVRDVQVDKGTSSLSMELKKNKRGLKDVENSNTTWNLGQAANNTSRIQREEAKIAAWENLQKAKAEAAIRKLEMKLEKKRSESMDKILNKLKGAQKKAQEMRSSSAESHDYHTTTSKKATFWKKYVKMHFLSSCFFCHTH